MTREVRKYFALVERLARFEPDDRTEPGKIHELMREGNAPPTPVEKADGSDSGGAKAA